MKLNAKKLFSIILFFLITLVKFSFADAATANIPVIISGQGLTPIKYVGGKWTDTTNLDQDWYDYENGVWANAGLGNKNTDGEYEIKYVWIPRFTYKIENDSIKIKWSNGKIDDTSDGYLRHPAFFFGEYVGGDPNNNSLFIDRTESRNELTGFWIQKDLFSENVTDISKSFNDSLKMTSVSKYKLPQAGMYPHMVKASEWGALAYLTEAKGKATNNRSTNNQTGVFLGDESEYVAGVNAEASSSLVAISSILNSNYRKYRDKLTKDLSSYYGYALTETSNRTKNAEPVTRDQFLVRGGNLGWFGYTGGTGNDGGKGYRTSISIITEELTDTISFFDTETSVVSGDYLILGVDFFVNVNDWTFPEEPDKFFEEVSMGELGDKKVVDIECIYETDIEWRLRDVNASVVKLIDPDLNTIPLNSIDSTTPHKSGKYTLIVKVGGVVDDTPVFMPMDNADVKIVVNELNLKDSNGIFIKIGNIPNNKVRLNVYGNSGSIVITDAILKKVPDQRKYALEEPLNVNDGIIVPYFGNWKGEEVPVNIENVLNPDITKTSGTHKVELQYNGTPVKPDPETQEEFIITVSKVKQVDVQGEIKVGTTLLNSKLLKGPGKYSRTDIDSPKDLTTHEFLNGYMFIDWDSNSTIVKANENSNKTTFTIPNEDAYLDTESVLITANYISPDSLNITNQKKEFIIGEDFSLGNGKLIVTYKNGQIQKEITLNELGLTVSITGSDKEHELTNLQEGDYLVTINYAEKTVSYPITVVKKKYGLSLSVNLIDYGTIKGKVLNGNVEKDSIVLNDEGAAYKQVSYDNTVTLTAEPKTGYTLKSWTVEGPEGLVAEEDKTKLQISFIMPQESVKIKANFTTAYTVTFKIKEGQEEYGSLEGEKVQVVIAGEDASTVTVKANDGFVFSKWLDPEENLISNEASLTRININEDQEFIAVFDDVWTVKFYNEDTIFKTKKVSNGKSGFIEEEPTKDEYVFMGWYPTPDSDPYTDEPQDLSSITSDINTYAVFVPRIDIKENPETEAGTIDATITGTMIKEGTFKYIISPSAEKPDGHFTNYELDDVFSGFTESDWENTGTMYRNKVVIDPGADSSAFLTITSSNAREIVCFDYILSTSGDSQLGITINGERVITPAEYVGPDWEIFEEDVEVIDGKITLGISYSQGESFNENDYAAIKNLGISNEWTIMDNHDGYHLIITHTPFEQNYIHVKGTGSDDDEVYRAVSECFVGIVKESYTITYDANGGINPPEAQTKTYNVDLQLSSIAPTRYGYEFLGWDTDKEAAYPNYKSGGVFNKNVDITLFAVWAPIGETYVVSYNANGGIGEPVDQIKNSGIELSLSNTTPTKEGYIFTCWNTAGDGTGTSYQPGASYTVDADVTLYAIWEVDAGKIAYSIDKNPVVFTTSLAKAIEIAESGNTITVVADATISEEAIVPLVKNITLNLNGRTLSTSLTNPIIVNGGLTITDSENGGIVSSAVSGNVINVTDSGDLTVKGGTITAIGESSYGIYSESPTSTITLGILDETVAQVPSIIGSSYAVYSLGIVNYYDGIAKGTLASIHATISNTAPSLIFAEDINEENYIVGELIPSHVTTNLINFYNFKYVAGANKWSNINTQIVDLMGRNNGTINGDTYPADYAFDFDGSSHWINLGARNIDNPTLEVVFNPDKVDTNMCIFSNAQSGGYSLELEAAGTLVMGVHINDAWRRARTTEPLEVGRKYHAIGTYDGTAVRLYLDGVEVATTPITGAITTTTNSTVLALGTNPNGTSKDGSLFDGKIYMARVYDRALSNSEVAQNYRAAIQGKDKHDIHTGGTVANDGVCTICSSKYVNLTSFAVNYDKKYKVWIYDTEDDIVTEYDDIMVRLSADRESKDVYVKVTADAPLPYGDITFTSSDTRVAIYENFTVIGLKGGFVTLTAECGSRTDYFYGFIYNAILTSTYSSSDYRLYDNADGTREERININANEKDGYTNRGLLILTDKTKGSDGKYRCKIYGGIGANFADQPGICGKWVTYQNPVERWTYYGI